jgi:hypothetical protein
MNCVWCESTVNYSNPVVAVVCPSCTWERTKNCVNCERKLQPSEKTTAKVCDTCKERDEGCCVKKTVLRSSRTEFNSAACCVII